MDAAKVNGINGHIGKYFNIAGDWQTWRDTDSVAEIPERLAQLTAAFFGVKGLLAGQPRLTGFLGVLIGVHALEHVTGAGATMLARLYGRGRPAGAYRGVTIRQGQGKSSLARLANKVTGRAAVRGDSFYFFEAGRTWHSQTATLQLKDEERTLTAIRSYSIPHREYYFDRAVAPQNVVDLVKGDLAPDSLPGFIGSVNELEDASGALGNLKRLFFAANWLLLDPGERDSGSLEADTVDYQALVKGLSTARSRPAADQPGAWARPIELRERGYSASRGTRQPLGASYTGPRPVTIKTTGPAAAPSPIPRAGLGQTPLTSARSIFGGGGRQTIKIDGQARPLVVRRIVKGVFSGQDKADAAWYDEGSGTWRMIVDDEQRAQIARAVNAGDLQVDRPGDWPL